jgi:hypothetical protein
MNIKQAHARRSGSIRPDRIAETEKAGSAGVIALIVILGVFQHRMLAAEKRQSADEAQTVAAESAQPAKAPSRYRFYDGRWWYWTPSNRWAWHDGRQWVLFQHDSVSPSGADAQNPARGESPETSQAGDLPAARPSIEALQAELVELQQTVRQLKARLRQEEIESRARAPHPWSSSDEARLIRLWRARRAASQFYDVNSSDYFFSGKGHFTD